MKRIHLSLFSSFLLSLANLLGCAQKDGTLKEFPRTASLTGEPQNSEAPKRPGMESRKKTGQYSAATLLPKPNMHCAAVDTQRPDTLMLTVRDKRLYISGHYQDQIAFLCVDEEEDYPSIYNGTITLK